MRTFSVFVKSLREQLRQPLVLSLSLVLPALFVLLYWMFFPGGGSTTYAVLVLNLDEGYQEAGKYLQAGGDLLEALQAVQYQNGDSLLELIQVEDRIAAERQLQDHRGSMLFEIPEDFSEKIARLESGSSEPAVLTFIGDLANPYYSVAAIFCSAGIEAYLEEQLGQAPQLTVVEEPLGDSAGRSEFELYVPGLLVFAVVLMVFQASMTVAAEVETGTLQRLRMTPLSALEYLAGTSMALEVIGLAALLLAFGVASLLGFESEGPLLAAVVIGAITGFAVIGAGLIVAALSRTVAQAFLIANVPLVLYMFFTGVIYPIPAVPLFQVGVNTVDLFDLLPPTHAVIALNKVFSLGAGWGEVVYQMAALTILSLLTFAAGVWLFHRRQMRLDF